MKKKIFSILMIYLLVWGFAFAETLENFDYNDKNSLDWRIEDDGVMGGLSKGKYNISKSGIMVFEGNLSLENDGGFSSVQTHNFTKDLSEYDGVIVRVMGDGRTYQFWLSTDANYRGKEMAFIANIPTQKSKWSEVKIPFSRLVGHFRGRNLKSKLFEPSKVRRMRFLLADKSTGRFKLRVDWIKTYKKKAKATGMGCCQILGIKSAQ